MRRRPVAAGRSLPTVLIGSAPMTYRNVYLRIEPIYDYSPVEPDKNAQLPITYKRDGMHNVGHVSGRIPNAERDARSLRAVVFRQYSDEHHLIPCTSKTVAADINEPVWDRQGTWCYHMGACRRTTPHSCPQRGCHTPFLSYPRYRIRNRLRRGVAHGHTGHGWSTIR